MIDLGLDADERTAFHAQLRRSHRIRVRVAILNRAEEPISDLDAEVVAGAVQVDSTADVTRSLELTLLDPRRSLRFDPASPSDLALYADNFLAVERGVYVEALGRWIDVPVFWGPVTQFVRKGAEVKLEGSGKETLMLDPHLATQGYQLRKGARLDAAVRQVAGRVGETRYNLPDLPQRLSRTRIVEPESEPWKVLRGGDSAEHYQQKRRKKKRGGKGGKGGAEAKPPGGLVAAEQDFDCFYDGRGRLTVRRVNRNSIFTFAEDLLTDEPEITYDVGEFRNYVKVDGGRAKGSKKAAQAAAQLPASNPMSPAALGRNGRPRYMTMPVDADSAKTNAACRRRAALELGRVAQQGVSGSFPSLPVPHLEENDSITLRTAEETITFTLRAFTIPLTDDAAMSVGALTRIRAR
jgi:hypothetical protein